MSEGGKRSCKYYKACGNTENCLRCTSFVKTKKNKLNRKDLSTNERNANGRK